MITVSISTGQHCDDRTAGVIETSTHAHSANSAAFFGYLPLLMDVVAMQQRAFDLDSSETSYALANHPEFCAQNFFALSLLFVAESADVRVPHINREPCKSLGPFISQLI